MSTSNPVGLEDRRAPGALVVQCAAMYQPSFIVSSSTMCSTSPVRNKLQLATFALEQPMLLWQTLLPSSLIFMRPFSSRLGFGHDGGQAPRHLPRQLSSSDLCHIQKCENFGNLRSEQLLHLDIALGVSNRTNQLEAIIQQRKLLQVLDQCLQPWVCRLGDAPICSQCVPLLHRHLSHQCSKNLSMVLGVDHQ
jgi:hypothetical protein